VTRVGVEGSGAYGAGLARFLRRAGIEVIEVDRSNRQARRQRGKSDSADAVEAARAAQGGRAQGVAKSRDGTVEAIRALIVARRSAQQTRIATLNQMRQLCFTAPDEIRERFDGLSAGALTDAAAGLRPRPGLDAVSFATKTSLRALGRRVLYLDEELARVDDLLGELVGPYAPELLAIPASVCRPRPSWSWPPAIIPSGSAPRQPGPIFAGSPRSRRPPARSPVTALTGEATAKPTRRRGPSSWSACPATPAPAPASPAAAKKDVPSAKSSECSSATSPARSTATGLASDAPGGRI
jgi:hypothetical protein